MKKKKLFRGGGETRGNYRNLYFEGIPPFKKEKRAYYNCPKHGENGQAPLQIVERKKEVHYCGGRGRGMKASHSRVKGR